MLNLTLFLCATLELMRYPLSLLVAACLFNPSQAFAWWETGHQTVARIAAAHLNPTARTRIAHILSVEDTPTAVADALAKASTWADEVRTQTNTGEWHYIDLTLQDSESDISARCKDDNCAPARIRLFAAQLTSKTTDSRWSDLDALRFLVHFTGDIHQPLHAVSDADLGGNCEHLDPAIGRAKNLHALWDGEIVNAIIPDDKALAADLEKDIAQLSPEVQKRISTSAINAWVWESHELAIQDVYGKLHIPTEPVIFPKNCDEAPADITNLKPQVDMLYIDTMKPVVREQLTKAGLRLAAVLNQLS